MQKPINLSLSQLLLQKTEHPALHQHKVRESLAARYYAQIKDNLKKSEMIQEEALDLLAKMRVLHVLENCPLELVQSPFAESKTIDETLGILSEILILGLEAHKLSKEEGSWMIECFLWTQKLIIMHRSALACSVSSQEFHSWRKDFEGLIRSKTSFAFSGRAGAMDALEACCSYFEMSSWVRVLAWLFRILMNSALKLWSFIWSKKINLDFYQLPGSRFLALQSETTESLANSYAEISRKTEEQEKFLDLGARLHNYFSELEDGHVRPQDFLSHIKNSRSFFQTQTHALLEDGHVRFGDVLSHIKNSRSFFQTQAHALQNYKQMAGRFMSRILSLQSGKSSEEVEPSFRRIQEMLNASNIRLADLRIPLEKLSYDALMIEFLLQKAAFLKKKFLNIDLQSIPIEEEALKQLDASIKTRWQRLVDNVLEIPIEFFDDSELRTLTDHLDKISSVDGGDSGCNLRGE